MPLMTATRPGRPAAKVDMVARHPPQDLRVSRARAINSFRASTRAPPRSQPYIIDPGDLRCRQPAASDPGTEGGAYKDGNRSGVLLGESPPGAESRGGWKNGAAESKGEKSGCCNKYIPSLCGRIRFFRLPLEAQNAAWASWLLRHGVGR
jgi:hypothetical protein